MRAHWRLMLFVASIVLAVATGVARAQEIPLVTGEHWTRSSAEMKKAYLIGVANIAVIEMAYGAAPAPDTQSILPRMAKGLKGQTLDSVRDALDRWYAAHPDQIRRPVVETIWFELVVPGLRK